MKSCREVRAVAVTNKEIQQIFAPDVLCVPSFSPAQPVRFDITRVRKNFAENTQGYPESLWCQLFDRRKLLFYVALVFYFVVKIKPYEVVVLCWYTSKEGKKDEHKPYWSKETKTSVCPSWHFICHLSIDCMCQKSLAVDSSWVAFTHVKKFLLELVHHFVYYDHWTE